MRHLTNAEYAEVRAAQDEIYATLTATMAERGQRADIVQDGARFNPAWLVHERETMLAAVNAERRRRGLDDVDVSEVIGVEEQACGHIDYAAKWAYGCARLAVGLER